MAVKANFLPPFICKEKSTMGINRVGTLEKQKIALLAAAGKSQRAIGRTLGRDNETIALALKDPKTQKLKAVVEEELSIMFSHVAKRALSTIDDEKLERSSARDLGILAGVSIDKHRLISGQSTSNASIMLQAVMSSLNPYEEAEESSAEG
jgi:hypothetical protein